MSISTTQRKTYEPSQRYLDPDYRDHSDQGERCERQELRNAMAMKNAVKSDLARNALTMRFCSGNMSEEEVQTFRGVREDQLNHLRRLIAMTEELDVLLA
jgi:hypothetical protein